MKKLLLLNFSLLAFSAFSQIQLKGNITDAESGETIPYANVYLKNHPIGTTAFRDGSFSLKLDSAFHDSIIFSIIGYEPKSLFLPEVIKAKRVSIKLEPSQEELQVVEVVPRKLKSYETGLVKKRAKYSTGMNLNKPRARYIPNEHQVQAYIKSVSVYVAKKGIPDAPFRVNILTANPVSGAPSSPLINKDYVLRGKGGNEWVTLDLEEHLLKFPMEGFFVVIQPLPIDSFQMESYTKRLPNYSRGQILVSAPTIGGVPEPYAMSAQFNWIKGWFNGEWAPYWKYFYDSGKVNDVQRSSASSIMIKAEINYYADQKLKIKDLKTKRAVKKVFDRPKENTLKYPQSSPLYLLSSLKKAFEVNDLAYVCNYLVYYEDKDELEETMAFLESQADDAGKVTLSEKEKEDVIDLLNSMSTRLQNLKPSVGDRFVFELEYEGELFYFQNKNGAWKINPRSTSVLRPNQKIKIPARF